MLSKPPVNDLLPLISPIIIHPGVCSPPSATDLLSAVASSWIYLLTDSSPDSELLFHIQEDSIFLMMVSLQFCVLWMYNVAAQLPNDISLFSELLFIVTMPCFDHSFLSIVNVFHFHFPNPNVSQAPQDQMQCHFLQGLSQTVLCYLTSISFFCKFLPSHLPSVSITLTLLSHSSFSSYLSILCKFVLIILLG